MKEVKGRGLARQGRGLKPKKKKFKINTIY